MKLYDLNPHIRFASQLFCKSSEDYVQVRDCRLFYIISGEGEIFIGNQHYHLKDNSLFFCCAGNIYKIKSKNGMSLISINFDLSQANNMYINPFPPAVPDEKLDIFKDTVSDSEILNSHIHFLDVPKFYSQTRKIFYEFSEKKIHFREISGAVLKEILIDIHRKALENTTASVNSINTVIDYINLNFSKEITNQDLASLSGYHEYHLNRLFLRHTGTSMHNYILNMRINEAKRLILNTDLSLNTIAENVGFKSYTHFSSYFKKVLELSPIAYRNKFKNKI